MINFCWFWFKWGLITSVVGAALLVPYFYHRLDEEIRVRLEQKLTKAYPDLHVKVRSAMLMKGEGIVVRGLTIVDPAAEGPGAEILSLEECFLSCRTDLQNLMTGEPDITRITIRRPTIRLTRRADGRWSTAKLVPFPKLSADDGPPPEVRIENGTIEIFDPWRAVSNTVTLRDVNLTIAAHEEGSRQKAEDRGRNSDSLHVEGTLSGDVFRQVVFNGEVDPSRPYLDLVGKIEGMEISPELRGMLPEASGDSAALLGSLRGQLQTSFHIRYDDSQATPWQFDALANLARGRIDDPRLPHPLTDIRASIHANNQGFEINDLTARSNQASIQLACIGRGYAQGSPIDLHGTLRQLDFDRSLFDRLPEDMQAHWLKFRPEGQVDADVHLIYDGTDWKPELHVRCLNVSFAHHKFPYRLDRGRGTIDLRDNRLQINMTAYSGNKLIRLEAEVISPKKNGYGWFKASGDDLPIDERLLEAMNPQGQAVMRQLALSGIFGFEFEVSRKTAQEEYRQHLYVRASRCGLRYEKFPYSISNIHGIVEKVDDNWSFHNLVGSNGATLISGEGTFVQADNGSELKLRLRAADAPLSDELRDALKPEMRQVWGVIQPKGLVDLAADVTYRDQDKHLDVRVRAEPRSDTTSIEPVYFPYHMDKLQGIVNYANGRVTFDHIHAEHEAVGMACNGFCDFQPDGSWQLHLDNLTVDRLRLDRGLRQALPSRLKQMAVDANPSGPMSLRGSLDFAHGGNPQDPLRSQWNLNLGLNQVGIDFGAHLDNIHGSVAMIGGCDGEHFQSAGEMSLDAVTYRDHQFTQVMGPLWIDDQALLLGSWVGQRENRMLRPGQAPRPLRPVTGRIFGGSVLADGWVALGNQPRFAAAASLVDADLAACAREMSYGKGNLKGHVLGSVEVHGVGRSTNELVGHGSLHLRDANVYELPVMVSMLKILNNHSPDQNAFSKSDMEYRIEGEHIYFDKLDFNGDAISLLGKGEMNFAGDTRLNFAAVVGRGEIEAPMLRRIFTGASQQFLVIHVNGNIQNPDIRQEAFPGINEALQQLQGPNNNNAVKR